MTQVEDEKRQARLAGGLLTIHRQMKVRQNNCNLLCLQEEMGRGFLPGFQSDSTSTPHSQTHTDQNQRHTFPATQATFLCVAMETQDSLSFPPLSHEQM